MKANRPKKGSGARQPPPNTNGKWIIAALAIALLLALGFHQLTKQHDLPTAVTTRAAPEPPLPTVQLSEYQNALPQATYVGTERCQQCHADQHASYLATAHSGSFALVDPANEPQDGQFDHTPSRRRLRAYRAGGQLRHAESLLLADGGELELYDRPLKYLVGSGRFARTYLAEFDGFLVESPLTWYTSLSTWRMSPGYDGPRHSSFRRDIDVDCLHCHVGRAEYTTEPRPRLVIEEPAIGCERCHGPGSIHIRQREAGERETGGAPAAGERDLSIVNPRRLPRDLAESICQQCHLESVTSAVVRGRRHDDFRPGLLWTDFVANFAYQRAGGMTVTGHVEQMHASKCYQQSTTMTCTTCHDPHHAPSPDGRPLHYRSHCLNCHDQTACRATAAQRTERGDDCTACHMPRSAVEIPHLAFTHHRIGIHPAGATVTADETKLATALVPILDSSRLSEFDQQRLLGLAYWRHHAEGINSRWSIARPRANELLSQVAQRGLHDGPMAVAIAALALEENDRTRATAEAQRALADSTLSRRDRVHANELLSVIYVQENRLSDAIAVLDQLIQQRPHPQDWFLLGVCRQRQGDVAGAIQAFEHVVAIDPTEPRTYHTLASLYALRGDAEAARRHLKSAELIESNLPQGPNR